MLDAQLAGKYWLVGNELTLADIVTFNSLLLPFQLMLDGNFRKAMPNVAAWFAKMSRLPLVTRTAGFVKCLGGANAQRSQKQKPNQKPKGKAAGTAEEEVKEGRPRGKEGKLERLEKQVDESVRTEWENEQNRLKALLEESDRFDWRLDLADPANTTLERVAALDISYSKHDQKKTVAALIIFAYPSMKVIYEDFEKEMADYPYIPGFLAFKEIPIYTTLFDRLRRNAPELYPQLMLVDGNGILHTRNFGCASHVGVLFDVPTIGVGKTVFYIDGIDKNKVKELTESNLNKAGDFVPLVGQSGKTWGVALRSTDASSNPVIVSQGHRVSLQTAIDATMACIRGVRIPEPIRQADLRSRALVRQFYDTE